MKINHTWGEPPKPSPELWLAFQKISSSFALQEAFLQELKPYAHKVSDAYTDIVLLGTGGSSLGAQTFCALQRKKRFHFIENIDADSFDRLFAEIDLKSTFCLVVSKSGQTIETLSQLLYCFPQWNKPEHFLIITENKESPLRALANHWKIHCLEHPSISGRYSCFSIVGMFPALIAGLSADLLIRGAKSYFQAQLSDPLNCAPFNAAASLYALSQQGKTQVVMMPYCDRLRPFGRWFAQLWAESLGKNGKGLTPLIALGTPDQHSHLQLYLDGPQDKVFTFITLSSSTKGGKKIKHDFKAFPFPIPLLQGKGFSDLMAAAQRATLETIAQKGCPVREIKIEVLNEESLGALLMHFILETLAMSLFLDVNPFDQPAVEQGKVLTLSYLKEKG